MKKEIKIAIAGVGNCASSLIQGIFYYKSIKSHNKFIPGLMHSLISDYKISDIKPVIAFDVDSRKIGKDLSQAIFEKPNCTKVFCSKIPKFGVKVQMGPILDGVANHMEKYPRDKRFMAAQEKPMDIAKELKKVGAEILLNYVPTGSEEAAKFYARAALSANCAFINCMPVFIASNKNWAEKFKKRGLPVIGDDIKSQIGGSFLHRGLNHLLIQRGIQIDRAYQLNIGGNTDFLNMLDCSRRKLKEITKTETVQSQLSPPIEKENLHIGPSDYVPWLKDNKICYIRIEGKNFGGVPIEIDLKLSVEDSPNSAGCVIDTIRLAKLALDRKIGGPLLSASAYFMKHPPLQYNDEKARKMLEDFIAGKKDN